VKTNQEHHQNKPEMTPEIQLWVSVIIVALHDSRMDFNDVSIVERKAPNHRIYYDFVDSKDFRISKQRTLHLLDCVEARMWFEKKDEQFQLVCHLANLNPEWVFNLYRDMLERDNINPTEILKRFFAFKF
tara:strand:+ start:41 stop:430 length:390 start_codon:yes stop_codon:yes gene_type:complete